MIAPLVLAVLAIALLLSAMGYFALVNRLEAPYTPELQDAQAWADELSAELAYEAPVYRLQDYGVLAPMPTWQDIVSRLVVRGSKRALECTYGVGCAA
jgi:hypothetical protein